MIKEGFSNAKEKLIDLKGETIKGVIDNKGEITLLLESGYGFTFTTKGSFWTVSEQDVKKIIDKEKGKLNATKIALEHILELAGEQGNKRIILSGR